MIARATADRLAEEDELHKGAGLGELGLGVDPKKQAAFEIKGMFGSDMLSKQEIQVWERGRVEGREAERHGGGGGREGGRQREKKRWSR